MFNSKHSFFGNPNNYITMCPFQPLLTYTVLNIFSLICAIISRFQQLDFIFRSLIDNKLHRSVKCDLVVTTKPTSQTNISTRRVQILNQHSKANPNLLVLCLRFIFVCNVLSQSNYQCMYKSLYIY